MSDLEHVSFAAGLAAYRAGRHFEAHEHWEELWRATPASARREYLQALIQIAAAMHKLVEKRQPDAALRLLLRASGRLGALPPGDWEVDVPALGRAVDRARQELERGGVCGPIAL